MRNLLALLMSAAPVLLGGCGTFVTDSVIEPYRNESFKPLGGAETVNGVRISSRMSPKVRHLYGTYGPFSVAIAFDGMEGSGKVAAVRSLEVTSGKETLFSRKFTSLRSGYPDHNSPGAQGNPKDIGGVRISSSPSDSLRFGFGNLFEIEHRPGRVITIRTAVEVSGGGSSETRELVLRHRAKTKRGVWQWYPPT